MNSTSPTFSARPPISNTALAFVLFDLLTGARRFALICQEARYASIASPGDDCLERRFVTPGEWRRFDSAMGRGWEPGPLPAAHIVSRMLTDEKQRRATLVQYVSSEPVPFQSTSAAVMLDAHLRATTARPQS